MNEEIEQETVENVAPVDEGHQQSGEMDQVAADNVEHQEQSQQSQQEINWRQANEALAQMKEEKARLAGELEALKSMYYQKPQQEEQKPSFFNGRERDDYAQIADLESYVSNVKNQVSQEVRQELEHVQLKAIDPNYKQTIEKYSKTLPQSVREQLARTGSWVTAYETVTNSAAYYRDQLASQQHPNAQKIMDNAQKPRTLSGVSQASTLSEASRYEQMSDADIIAMGDRYARGG